ncbi:hypothetical protein EYD00_23305 (plasmid) [Agrobacterium sp. 33MFTa1.1]|uniref:hypothetical protein n=1 Tax=Agrobacterium sp. 33MFTa1.1 TaxID=1279031 RepID=UPI00103937E0|nr:hypothetical protein [Agrobacterium sp. 33MFTa1.1]QBJ16408.1 hypothetical protein EYD00_23305 [Agrobacterium sp. 33MFTa1.1]
MISASKTNFGVLALLIGSLGSTSAESGRPMPGGDVDRTQTIRLLEATPAPCAEASFGLISVALSHADLETLANSSPRQPRSEADRLGKIRGKRAEELLEALKPTARLSDCVGRADGNAGVDWTYLVLELIENGIAAVFTDNGKPVRTVQIRYLGMRCGDHCGRGDIFVSTPDAPRPFLILNWWAS